MTDSRSIHVSANNGTISFLFMKLSNIQICLSLKSDFKKPLSSPDHAALGKQKGGGGSGRGVQVQVETFRGPNFMVQKPQRTLESPGELK